MLRAVAFGWRQEAVAQNAKEISQLGRDLHKRCADLGTHFLKIGDSLRKAVEAYNKSVGSFESRVLVSARKFVELGAANESLEIEPLLPLDAAPRILQAPEILGLRAVDREDEKNQETA